MKVVHSKVKHGYDKQAYNELMLSVKWISFLVTQLHVVILTALTNYAYNEAKTPIPWTSL